MRIGVDIDGVLADFNSAFIPRCIQVTGRDLFPPRPFDITTWNYSESYGYTTAEVSAVWDDIKKSSTFWARLGEYPTTEADLDALYKRQFWNQDEIYFITARPGVLAKAQTERWLDVYFSRATVLISSHKGLCAQALNLDAYIDDRDVNVISVSTHCVTKTFIMDRPWNRQIGDLNGGIIRVSSVSQMLALLLP